MSVTNTLSDRLPRYADGGFRPLLIDGQHVPAVSGKTFESRNPATASCSPRGSRPPSPVQPARVWPLLPALTPR